MKKQSNTRLAGNGQDTITGTPSADDIWPDPMVVALTRVFSASLTTAVEFGGADYAAAAAIAAEMVQAAIASAIEGRTS